MAKAQEHAFRLPWVICSTMAILNELFLLREQRKSLINHTPSILVVRLVGRNSKAETKLYVSMLFSDTRSHNETLLQGW